MSSLTQPFKWYNSKQANVRYVGTNLKHKKRILLVDDNPLMTDVFCIAFKEKGVDIEVEHQGKNVLDRAREYKPDLILLDLRMPEFSGFDVIKELKKDKGLQNIKVVIFTSVIDEKSREEALGLGAVDYINKSESRIQDVADLAISHLT